MHKRLNNDFLKMIEHQNWIDLICAVVSRRIWTESTTRNRGPTLTSAVSSGSCGGATTLCAGPRWRSARRTTFRRRRRRRSRRRPCPPRPSSPCSPTTFLKILKKFIIFNYYQHIRAFSNILHLNIINMLLLCLLYTNNVAALLCILPVLFDFLGDFNCAFYCILKLMVLALELYKM